VHWWHAFQSCLAEARHGTFSRTTTTATAIGNSPYANLDLGRKNGLILPSTPSRPSAPRPGCSHGLSLRCPLCGDPSARVRQRNLFPACCALSPGTSSESSSRPHAAPATPTLPASLQLLPHPCLASPPRRSRSSNPQQLHRAPVAAHSPAADLRSRGTAPANLGLALAALGKNLHSQTQTLLI
jgi:hypothetical protein